MKKILINPVLNIAYSAFYIRGLQLIYGKKNVSFADRTNIGLFHVSEKLAYFSFVVLDSTDNKIVRVVIDYGDSNLILEKDIYDWSDVFGKVNTKWEITPKEVYSKLICLATNFGIRSFSFSESIYLSFKNYSIVKPPKKNKYFANYIKQNNKLFIDQYPLTDSQYNYVFSVNTLWYNDEWNKLDETTNKIRAEFMEACLSMPDINFEGGFVPSTLGNNNFSHLHLKRPLSQKVYINKLKKSIVAFNTPAVWGCHGWKLGEFLCMGKATISTPLSNDLPAPLIHGESIHIVNNLQELKFAISLLNEDLEYRHKLEKSARAYYEEFVSPEASIKLLGII